MHVLLDASNLGATGPEVVIRGVVPLLGKIAPNDIFTLLLPSHKENEKWELPKNIRVMFVRRMRVREISRLWDINAGLVRVCRKCKADVYLTLGDIGPVAPPVPHVIYLHQPYLVYPESELTATLPLLERIKLRYQRWHFNRSVNNASAVIVQTPVMSDRLVEIYNVPKQKVHIVSPVLPSHLQVAQNSPHESCFPEMDNVQKVRLLFLATFYAHKNHAILPALIREIRKRNLENKVHFFLTLDGNRRRAETALLRELEFDQDLVTNLGRLPPEVVDPTLSTADALFMPTLVETFGLIYLEAMAACKPILTSDRDFARYLCGDLAIYFDPLDPVSIANAIEQLIVELPKWQIKLRQEAEKQISSVSQDQAQNAENILCLLRDQVNRV